MVGNALLSLIEEEGGGGGGGGGLGRSRGATATSVRVLRRCGARDDKLMTRNRISLWA
jgi:hypothetical protein